MASNGVVEICGRAAAAAVFSCSLLLFLLQTPRGRASAAPGSLSLENPRALESGVLSKNLHPLPISFNPQFATLSSAVILSYHSAVLIDETSKSIRRH